MEGTRIEHGGVQGVLCSSQGFKVVSLGGSVSGFGTVFICPVCCTPAPTMFTPKEGTVVVDKLPLCLPIFFTDFGALRSLERGFVLPANRLSAMVGVVQRIRVFVVIVRTWAR